MLVRTLTLAACALAAAAAMALEPGAAPPKAGEAPYYPGPWRIKDWSKHNVQTVLPSTRSTLEVYPDLPKSQRIPNLESFGSMENFRMGDGGKPGNPTPPALESPATEAIIHDFQSMTQNDPFNALNPPDPAMGVGFNEIVCATNSFWTIYDKAGRILYQDDIGDFLGDPSGFYFDPVVAFDPWRQRWIVMWHFTNSGTQASQLVITTSQQTSAIGNWWIYRFNANTGSGATLAWTDYANLGYTGAAVTAAGNQFRWSGGFQVASLRTWNPSEIYQGLAASMITDLPTTNPDGTTTTTPRAVKNMNNRPPYFINSRGGGGSRLTLRTINDPLGAHTITSVDINVAAYAQPTDNQEPGGGQLDSIDCRLMHPVYVEVGGVGRLATSLNTDHPSQPGKTAARLYIVNPLTNGVLLDWNYWYTVGDVWFASPAANYTPSIVWSYTHVSTSDFASARYVSWETTGFSNDIWVLANGTGNKGGGRWGDYFAADTDWYDFNFNGGSTGQQKIWIYGQKAHTGIWRTHVGATKTPGHSNGGLSVTGAAPTFTGFQGGPFTLTAGDDQFTVGNSGILSYVYDVTSPTFLNRTPTTGQLADAQTDVVTVSTNANANGRAYGRYTGNISFTNAYSGTIINRLATLVVRDTFAPTAFTVGLGQVTAGNVGSLASTDGNVLRVCKLIVPFAGSPYVRLNITSTNAGVSSMTAGTIEVRDRSLTSGLFRRTLMGVLAGGTGAVRDQLVTNSFPTSFANYALTLTAGGGSINDYFSGTTLGCRYEVLQTGPSASLTPCSEIDRITWVLTP
jgi:hypothetical protein